MKEAELRKHAKCTLCNRGIGHVGLPLFWRVTIERFGVDINAAKRLDGLAAMLGSPALASVMGPNEDLAQPLMEPAVLTICESCNLGTCLPIAALAEAGSSS
jgi:hypothetical protein